MCRTISEIMPNRQQSLRLHNLFMKVSTFPTGLVILLGGGLPQIAYGPPTNLEREEYIFDVVLGSLKIRIARKG